MGRDVRVRVIREASVLRVTTGVIEAELLPAGGVRIDGFEVAPVGAARSGKWVVAHACPVRVTVSFDAGVAADRCRRRWTWTFHAGSGRLDGAQHVYAGERTALPDGVGWRLTVAGAEALRFAGKSYRGRVALDRAGGRWRRRSDDRIESEDHGDAAGLAGSEPWSWLLTSGCETLTWDGEVATVLATAAGAVLEPGEGRIARAAWCRGPAAPVRAARLWVREPAGAPSDLVETSRALLERMLNDRACGFISEGRGRGDWRFGRDDAGNGEYDTTLGLLRFGDLTGHSEAHRLARAMADHLLGVDWDGAGSALFFPHGPGHREGPIEIGHHWIEGLCVLEDREPCPLRRGLLDEIMLRQIETFQAADLDRELPRSLGWGLLALSEAADRPGPHRIDTRAELERWRNAILDRQTPGGWLHLVALAGDPEVGNENPFVQGGIILPALVRSLTVVPSSRARSRTRRLARALERGATHVIDQECRLARRCVIDVGSGQVLSRTGAAPGEHAALFLAGLRSAGRGAAEPPHLRALRRTIPSTLRSDDKRFVGAQLSILLRSLDP